MIVWFDNLNHRKLVRALCPECSIQRSLHSCESGFSMSSHFSNRSSASFGRNFQLIRICCLSFHRLLLTFWHSQWHKKLTPSGGSRKIQQEQSSHRHVSTSVMNPMYLPLCSHQASQIRCESPQIALLTTRSPLKVSISSGVAGTKPPTSTSNAKTAEFMG